MDTMTPDTLRARLKERRMTQEELAEGAGMSKSALTEFLAGRRRLSKRSRVEIDRLTSAPSAKKARGRALDAIDWSQDDPIRDAVRGLGPRAVEILAESMEGRATTGQRDGAVKVLEIARGKPAVYRPPPRTDAPVSDAELDAKLGKLESDAGK
jgi:transcriptional regulator with XRE-family HTH domain